VSVCSYLHAFPRCLESLSTAIARTVVAPTLSRGAEPVGRDATFGAWREGVKAGARKLARAECQLGDARWAPIAGVCFAALRVWAALLSSLGLRSF